MRIKSLTLSGWRSFSSYNPVSVNGLRKINIFIGANNCGKSNVFRYLFYIREMYNRQEKIAENLINYDKLHKIASAFNEKDTWAWEKNDIIFEATLDDFIDEYFEDYIPKLHNETIFKLKAIHKVNENVSSFSIALNESYFLLEENRDSKPKILNLDTMQYEHVVEESKFALDTISYWDAFFKSLVFIDPVRHHARGKSQFSESDFDGSDIVNKIIDLKNNEDGLWIEYKSLLEKWLQLLLQEQVVLDPTNTKLRFYINRGGKLVSANLENLGTGVSQVVMLLSFLYFNKDKFLNVFMEEPESNLHPSAVVHLITILNTYFSKHSFYITTHSNTLIDQVDENWSIHRVSKDISGESKIESCNEVLTKFMLLDDLGIKPSQMLQSNLIIWVEGPSDRIYLKKWLKDKANLLEGKHYSFLMYGGSNLSSYSLLDNEEYIDILKTSRYSYIICDSDKNEETSELKKRVKDLIKCIDDNSKGNEKMSDYVVVEVTTGREIENYIPSVLFEKVLYGEGILRKYIFEKEQKRNLALSDTDIIFDKFASFDEVFSKKYLFEDGRELNDVQYSNIAASISNKKTEISKKIISSWEEEHYTDELNSLLDRLITHIKVANLFEDIPMAVR